MESHLMFGDYDLVTPDGYIETISLKNEKNATAHITIKNISSKFIGFSLRKDNVFFNLKSTLAQLGINSTTQEITLNKEEKSAEIAITLIGLNDLGSEFLQLLKKGDYLGKLFAADPERRVREPEYLMRMFGRCDEEGRPLLSLGHPSGRDDLILQKINGRTVAFLSLRKGIVEYHSSIKSFLPTLALSLKHKNLPSRKLLQLHQKWMEKPQILQNGKILLVKTHPLHVRTVFARVVDELLPKGYFHTSACVLQPDTTASGDIYEFYGCSEEPIKEIPLEFYTLEPYREYVFFSDRDQLQANLENPEILFKAFNTAPKEKMQAAVFIVKGDQLAKIKAEDWIVKENKKHEFPGLDYPTRQALLVEKYIEQHPAYPFLKAIEQGQITSQGILLSRYFPTPLLKRMLLSSAVQRCLKGIYFVHPSLSHGDFFSHEDRAFLIDLAKFAIPVFWVDKSSNQILQYVLKPEKDVGMFVPLPLIETFRKATVFGIYGSNLFEGNFENELQRLLQGILQIRKDIQHPLLNENTPIALLTGGGPGAMEVGNRIAKTLGILSCANIIDFKQKENSVVNEQKQNPHVEVKMTYRLERLVERQEEFHLDFPIFLHGGIGTDFEFALEEVRRKVGACSFNPVLLFGGADYWTEKITSRFQCNIKNNTIQGSEWVSNCFYCVQKAEQGLKIYHDFFTGKLPIGKKGPIYKNGFCIMP